MIETGQLVAPETYHEFAAIFKEIQYSDGDGNFKRLLVDGEEIPTEIAHMFADSFLSLSMLPFQLGVTQNHSENLPPQSMSLGLMQNFLLFRKANHRKQSYVSQIVGISKW